jgi:hypothetical protein
VVFSCFFDTIGAQNTVNTDVFGASEAKNHGIYDVFCPWEKKNHGIYSVLRAAPSKHWYLHSFQPVARSSFSMQKLQKHCKLQCFGRRRRPKKQQTSP